MASSHFIDFEMLDFSGEKSSFRVNTGAITVLSLPGFLTEFGNLRSALDAITKGTIARESWTGDKTLLSNIPPIDSMAQRELKWLLDYFENVHGYQFSCTIPCADPDKLNPAYPKSIDFSDPDVAAFVTAFEAIAVSPLDDTASVTVEGMQLVGRRL